MPLDTSKIRVVADLKGYAVKQIILSAPWRSGSAKD